MERIREADVDSLDRRIGQHLLVRAERTRDAVARSELSRPLRRPAADGDELGIGRLSDVAQESLVDRARTEDSPLDG